MKVIGDPHLGREFKNDVPLDRRGEREELMFAQFEKELTTPEKLVVIIGDLFDTPRIAYKHVFRTIRILQEHALSHPDKVYVIIAGNHDISPSSSAVGAFELLEVGMRLVDNVRVLRKPETVSGVVFFPWEWDRSAEEQLDDIKLWTDTAIGHWDLVDYGGDTGHLCPAGKLKERGVTRIISGHWHLAGVYILDDIEVQCVGSMQPMTHAEDPDGKMYVTLSLKEYLRTDAETLKDKYVRVRAEKGEEITPPPTCLGFKVQTVASEQEAQERVNLGEFDIDKILDKHLEAHGVPKPVQKEVKEHLSAIA